MGGKWIKIDLPKTKKYYTRGHYFNESFAKESFRWGASLCIKIGTTTILNAIYCTTIPDEISNLPKIAFYDKNELSDLENILAIPDEISNLPKIAFYDKNELSELEKIKEYRRSLSHVAEFERWRIELPSLIIFILVGGSDLEVLQASSAFIGAVLGDKCPIKLGRTRRQCKRAFFKNA
ncbi:hypothetical protein T4E_11653 [Trichinella pseudospiralis]|uniref:Uncharacterized protein n=1 Tax=Trichinella pseudospiralis TaxID=6337 RepID=A0A0V0Y483_TRIPS|nr:hypothetical protein T4E_11653 [Trichinella pseudospiralis]